MTESAAVSVQNVSKLYLLYGKPQDRLKQSLFSRLGKNYAHTFWALRNISFNLQRGETLGIIGRNGSGKSTLLQIIAGTLQPTEGKLHVQGRLTALLELGAGFNPEFTGRENILLNGAMLDISEKDMRGRMDEIIDFAQIGEFIDQPVKIYSSGMYVRLAFAIATSVDPDVLLIDEALAVGDIGFVIKCMNRMKQLREGGATILLVTHDVQTVRSFCDRAIWLNQGELALEGSPLDTTARYIQDLFEEQNKAANLAASRVETLTARALPDQADFKDGLRERIDLIRWGSGELRIEACSFDNGLAMSNPVFGYGERLHISLQILALQGVTSSNTGVGFAFRNMNGLDIITGTTFDEGLRISPLRQGEILEVQFSLDNILAAGDYALVVNLENRDEAAPKYYDFIENMHIFKVVSPKLIHSLVLPHIETEINYRG
jgi:lipopolysaccharide transport system ATP-binding protein